MTLFLPIFTICHFLLNFFSFCFLKFSSFSPFKALFVVFVHSYVSSSLVFISRSSSSISNFFLIFLRCRTVFTFSLV